MSIIYVLSTLRRRWLTVLVTLLLGALAGAAFAQYTPVRYSATSSLVVASVVSNPMTGTREDVNIRTEQEILGSREVSRRAAESLNLDEEGDSALRAEVEVAAPSGSQILQVTVRASTAEQAADGANAIANSYLDMRRENATEATERYLESVDQQIEDLRAAPPTDATDGLIERLQQQRSSVALLDLEPGQIIGSAIPPGAPSGPGLLITVAGGAMAGLLLGVATAILTERLDPRVRSSDRLLLATGPQSVIESKKCDDHFWLRLADEAIHRSSVDISDRLVRVLLHPVAPSSSREDAANFREAARRILNTPEDGLTARHGDAERGQVAASLANRVAIVPSGPHRSSLAQAARRSDVAVIVAEPRASLKNVAELVTALQECNLAVVVGLAKETAPTAPSDGRNADQITRPGRPVLESENREVAVALSSANIN